MTQRCCSRIGNNRLIKRIEDQTIVVVVTDHICDNPPVIEIKYRAKIHFMLVLVLIIPFEFCDVRQPFLIWSFRCEISVQYVICNKLGIYRLSCTPVIGILDRGLNPFLTADPKHSFIICLDSVITFQIIPYSAIALIRTGYMDFFDFISNVFICCFISRFLSVKPFVVCRTAYRSQFAERTNRITMLFVFFFDCLIDLPVSDQA